VFAFNSARYLFFFAPTPLSTSVLAVEATKKFLSDNPDATPSDITDKVTNEQMASGLKSQDRIHIFVRAAFTTDFFKHKQVEKNAPTISKITQGKTVMERHLISACEGLCVDKPKIFAVLLKQLFDEDILDENTIFEWAGEGRTDYTLDCVDEDQRCAMRAEAEPVVVWLQEDDSSDEDSD
jgi:translation initiation factor 5